MLRKIAPALLALSALGILARVPVVSAGNLRIDGAIVLIFAAAAYHLARDWVYALALLGASLILDLFGVALPLPADVLLLLTGAFFAFTIRRVPKWLQAHSPSSS